MKRKGFTLIELLITIVLLGVIGTIVILSMTDINNNSKEKDYERFIATITSAASVYGSMNPEHFQDLYVNKSFIFITLDDLISSGLLDENLKNPYTDKLIDKTEFVQVDLDADGALAYTYPVDKVEINDTFLVALSDYVIFGEPYNCMQGAGTYQLSLSDESGNLIQLDQADNMMKYKFSCTMSNANFTDYKENNVLVYNNDENVYDTLKARRSSASESEKAYIDSALNSYKYMQPKKAGNYEIVYEWVTESGVKKSMKRILRVMEKVTPTITFTNSSGGAVNPSTIVRDNGTYYFQPEIEGADKTTTSFILTVNAHSGSGSDGHQNEVSKKFPDDSGYVQNWPTKTTTANVKTIVGSYSNKWESIKEKVFEGRVDYNIKVIVGAHYYKKYSYKATNSVTFEKDIIIPTSKITNLHNENANRYEISKQYSISDLGLLVPVDHYEFYLSTGGNDVPKTGTPKTGNVTSNGTVTLNNVGTCASSKMVTYEYVYFRAVNKNGYTGSWSPLTGTPTIAKLSNDLNKLAASNANAKNVGGYAYGSLVGLQKYFNTKSVYVKLTNKDDLTSLQNGDRSKISNNKYVVLGTFANDILLAGDYTSKTSLAYVSRGSQYARHCDGGFNVSYTYSSAAYGNIIEPLANYVNGNLPTLANNLASSSYVVNRNWYADFGGTSSYKYTGRAGMPTSTQYNLFGSVLSTNTKIWLGNSTTSNYSAGGMDPGACCHPLHVAYVSYSSTKVYTNYGWSTGGSYSTKPMFAIIDMAACAGTGTESDPYIVVGTR